MFRLALLLLAALVLASCGSVRPVSGEDEAAPPPPRVEAPPYPAYETFDPSGYDAEPAAPEPAALEHDVPEILMAGTIEEASEPEGPRLVEGFRIQVFSSAEKAAAERVRDEVGAWWRLAREDPGAAGLLPEALPVAVEFLRPYYRVRLGAFEFRPQAEAALDLVRERFPEAFIVPSTVEVDS